MFTDKHPSAPTLKKSTKFAAYTPGHIAPESGNNDNSDVTNDIDLNYHPLVKAVKYTLSMVAGDRIAYLQKISPSAAQEQGK